MFAADADVQLGINGFAELNCRFHELADACLIELCERIILEDLGVVISIEELAGVITGEAEGHLSEVIGAEAEEVRDRKSVV